MIKKLHLKSWFLLLCMIVGASTAWADEVTFNFSELAKGNNWSNGTAYTSVTIAPVTLSALGGGNNGKYYTSDTSWRMYSGGTVNISAADGYEITAVSSTPSQTFTISNGSASLSCSATIRFTEIVVTYAASSTVEKCATPTFSLEENYYKGAQSVNISTATEGATIYYTTDGSTPSTSSNSGTTVTISETCILKAIAVKEGLNESALGSATYAIVDNAGTQDEPFTVADARNILTAFPSKTFDDVCVSGIISQIDSYSSNYNSITYWISDDGTTTDQFEVYSGKGLNGADFSSKDDLIVGSTVVVKGKIKKYNSTFEFDVNSVIVSMEAVSTPIINAIAPDPLEYNATSGEIAYTITNPATGDVSLTASTTADWISDITVGERTVTFSTTRNEGTENRTATINLAYTGAEPVSVTITQKYYVADFATLPFSFDGGKSNIENTAGLTQSGLGSDYNSSPKLKFTETGNWVVLHFDERPGTLTYDIKGNSFSGGIFTVQTSADGNTWNQLTKYEAFGSNIKSEEFNNLASDVRYIRWIYTKKSSGNVALGNISLAAYVAPQTYTLTIPSTDNVNISAAYDIEGIINEGEVAEIEQGTEIILTVDVDEGYDLQSLTVIGGETPFAPRPDSEDSYKFTMPAYNATVNAKVVEHVEPATATYTLATRITSGKHYVIASGTEGSVKVMGNQGGNNRPAAAASIRDGVLSVSDEYEFIIESATIDEAIGYSIYDAGVPGYLYAASSSSNYLKTQATNNANGIWKIEINSEGIASVVAQGSNSRKVMQYNSGSQLFACYGTASQSPIYLFEKVEATPEPVTVNVSAAGYSTLYYGDRNLVVPANMEAYTVKVTTQVERSTTYNAGDVIPAGTGVVLKAAQGSYTFNVSATAGDKDNANMLRGSDVKAQTTGGTYYYALTLNAAKDPDSAGFYWMVENGGAYQAGAHKAYLALDNTFAELAGNGTAKGYLALPGDETDGIGQIEFGQTGNAGIYNLNGQKVNKAQKGIYIVNGKKVVIR